MTDIERLTQAMNDPELIAQAQRDMDALADDISEHGFGVIPLADGSTLTVDCTGDRPTRNDQQT